PYGVFWTDRDGVGSFHLSGRFGACARPQVFAVDAELLGVVTTMQHPQVSFGVGCDGLRSARKGDLSDVGTFRGELLHAIVFLVADPNVPAGIDRDPSFW